MRARTEWVELEVDGAPMARGFVVIAPELYHRTAPGFELDTLDMAVLMPLIESVTPDRLLADARAAHAWLAARPEVDAARVVAPGFCMGGRAAYLANAALPLAAAVSYHAGGVAPALLDRATTLSGPHPFFWGGRDPAIPTGQHRAVTDAVRAAGKPFVDVEFSEAMHAFFNARTDRYQAPSAALSWAIATTFPDDGERQKSAHAARDVAAPDALARRAARPQVSPQPRSETTLALTPPCSSCTCTST